MKLTREKLTELAIAAGFHMGQEFIESPFVEDADLTPVIEAFAELIIAECGKDSERLQWVIENEAAVYKHPNDPSYTCATEENDCWAGDTARDSIDAAMGATS